MAVRIKHLRLDQKKIDRARQLLGARSDQETVERALDVVLAPARVRDRLEEAERDVKEGRVLGPFCSANTALRAVKRRAHARRPV